MGFFIDPRSDVSNRREVCTHWVTLFFLDIGQLTTMPKKRGRPHNKQATGKRGPGMPRKKKKQKRHLCNLDVGGDHRGQKLGPILQLQQWQPCSNTHRESLCGSCWVDEGSTPVFKPVQPVEYDAKFQMPPPRPNCENFEDVLITLTRVYLTDRYVLKVFGNTLTYIQKRHLRRQRTFKIVPRDILHFFSMIHYMGYCRLPCKQDYWCEGDDVRGDHPICRAFGMMFKKFMFLWRNIYLMDPGRDDVGKTEFKNEGETEYDTCSSVHYVVRADPKEDNFHFDEKVQSMIELTNQGNKLICHWPSHVMRINEQMTRARGRTKETYKINNKAITYDYKSFSTVQISVTHIAVRTQVHERGNHRYRQVCGWDIPTTSRPVLCSVHEQLFYTCQSAAELSWCRCSHCGNGPTQARLTGIRDQAHRRQQI